MKKITLLLFCLSISVKLFQQPLFQKGIGNGSDVVQFNSVHLSPDGNYIMAGRFVSGGFGGVSGISLVKTNTNGDTIWTQVFNGPDTLYNACMQKTSDNGFIIAGQSKMISSNEKVLVVKTDSNGNISWSKTYDNVSLDYERAYAIKQAANGDYILCGSRGNTSTISVNLFVMRIDLAGNLIWTKTFINNNGDGFSLDNTSDGGIIITGNIFLSSNYRDLYLLKLNSAGNIMWSKAYDGRDSKNDVGYSVKETNDKGFIVTGVTFVAIGTSGDVDKIYLLKTDSLGNLSWSKKFGGSGNDGGSCVNQTSDGGYILGGYTTSFVGNGLYSYNAFLIKTNPNGVVIWCKYYGGNINSEDKAEAIAIASDGGFVVAGATGGSFNDGYLFKTDVSGYLPCNGYSWALYDSIYNSTVYALNFTVSSPTLSVGTPNIVVGHIVGSTYDPCTVGINELKDEIDFEVFPNPSSGKFNLKTERFGKYKIGIYNSIGQEILTQEFEYEIPVDISSFGKGIYYLEVRNLQNGESGNKKIVFQ